MMQASSSSSSSSTTGSPAGAKQQRLTAEVGQCGQQRSLCCVCYVCFNAAARRLHVVLHAMHCISQLGCSRAYAARVSPVAVVAQPVPLLLLLHLLLPVVAATYTSAPVLASTVIATCCAYLTANL
jgi:hypothetical protein